MSFFLMTTADAAEPFKWHGFRRVGIEKRAFFKQNRKNEGLLIDRIDRNSGIDEKKITLRRNALLARQRCRTNQFYSSRQHFHALV